MEVRKVTRKEREDEIKKKANRGDPKSGIGEVGSKIQKAAISLYDESGSGLIFRFIVSAILLVFYGVIVNQIMTMAKLPAFITVIVFTLTLVWVMRGVSIAGIYQMLERQIQELEPQGDNETAPKELVTADQISIYWKFITGALLNFFPVRIVIAYITAGFILLAFYVGIEITFVVFLIFACIIAYVIYKEGTEYFNDHVEDIKADPPHIGVLTLFGHPRRVILASGKAFTRPPFIGSIPIESGQQVIDFETMGGFFSDDKVPMMLKNISLIFFIDLARIIEYIKAGKKSGIANALEDLIPSKLRPLIAKEKVDELTGSGKEDPHKLENEVIHDLLGLEDNEKVDPASRKDMARNGKKDAHNFGIKIYRFTIGPVTPTPEYAENMEQKATEIVQRDYERYEIETIIGQANAIHKAYKDAGETVSYEECLDEAMDKNQIEKGFNIIPGLRRNLKKTDGGTSLAGLAAMFLGNKGGGGGNKGDSPQKKHKKQKRSGKYQGGKGGVEENAESE